MDSGSAVPRRRRAAERAAAQDTKAVIGGKNQSTRERMEEHRTNPEHVGRGARGGGRRRVGRDVSDLAQQVDALLHVPDEVASGEIAGLREGLLKHSDIFLETFTENLMTYALGRRVEYSDMPAIRAILRDAGKNNNRLSSFVLGVVTSGAFRMAKADSHLLTTDAREPKRSTSGPQR
jgi:hypothetical protein